MEKYYWQHPFDPEEHCMIRNLDGETLDIVNAGTLIDLSLDSDIGIIPGLYQDGSIVNDMEMKIYIETNVEQAIYKAVDCTGESKYILNVHHKDALPSQIGGEVQLAKQQVNTFLPIIKYFLQHGFKELFRDKKLSENAL